MLLLVFDSAKVMFNCLIPSCNLIYNIITECQQLKSESATFYIIYPELSLLMLCSEVTSFSLDRDMSNDE